MAKPIVRKSNKDEVNKEIISMEEVAKDARSFLERALGDISKTSASKQLVIGSVSGWTTGFVTMKIGKMAAVAVGGGILLLQVANHKGYISIDWDKITKKADKVGDKIEEAVTGEAPRLMDKIERFVDRKIDKAEDLLKKNQKKAKKWYHGVTGDKEFKLQEIHIFIGAFAAGVALGIASA